MKLRNKLVAVLAASMVVTSVPVVTMASSNNYVSTSRNAQKGTTYGYTMGTVDGYDAVYGDPSKGIGGTVVTDGYDYRFTNAFEFVPTNGFNQTESTFMSLTSDSDFNAQAILTYVDAFNSKSGVSYLVVKGGVVYNANNPYYNGKKVDDLLKSGVTVYYDGNAQPTAASLAAGTGITAAQVSAQVGSVFDAKVLAAGSDLYTAMSNDDVLADVKAKLQDEVQASLDYVDGEVSVATKNAPAAAILNEVMKEVKANNAAITTSYNQLYATSANGAVTINETKLAEIITDTITEVAEWAKLNNVTDSVLNDALDVADVAQITIKKVDRINFKDADDREYKSHLEVITSGSFTRDKTYRVPTLAKLGGDKVVLLNVDGQDSSITSGKYNLSQDTLTDKRLTVTADSAKIRTNYSDTIGEIRFTESQIKSLSSNDRRVIKIVLPAASDLEFNLSKTVGAAQVTGKRGFFNVDVDGTVEGATVVANNISAKADDLASSTSYNDRLRIAYGITERRNNYTDVDTKTLLVELPKWADTTAVGELVLKGLYVQPVDDIATAGDVNATISEYVAPNAKSTNLIASTTVKVAEVKDYDIALTCEKPTDIKAGRSGIMNEKSTTFVLEEAVKDSLVDGRKIKFTVENGYIFGPADVDYSTTAANSNNYYATGIYGTTAYKERAEQRFLELIDNEKIKFEEKAGKDGNDEGFVRDSLSLEIDAEGRVIGFSGEYDRLKEENADKIKVTMPIATDVMSTGEVKVSAENVYTRSFQDKEEDPSCVIANVIAPIEVSFDGAKLKVGKQAQEAGSIEIKETDKGMLENGWLFLAAQDQEGITFDSVPDVTVEGTDGKTLTVKTVALSKDKTMLGLEITKESLEASTIKISNINLTSDRTVPEANYDLAIWGTSLTDENELGITNFTQNALYSHAYFNQSSDLYTVADFIQMTTVNTEDLIGAAKAVTASFKMGENKFTVNGEEVSMDKAAYIKDNLTFVPVRYVAQAFGITGNQVQYDQKTSTATIVYGDKAINIKAGDAFITVNGTPVPMATRAEVVDGRMCVPMAYIANALGVNKSWDAATKTATFSNVNK